MPDFARGRIAPLALSIVATATLFAVVLNWTYHRQVERQLDRIEEQEEDSMISTTWKSEGKTKTCTSRWKEHDAEETYDQFLERHDQEVAACMRKWPEDS